MHQCPSKACWCKNGQGTNMMYIRCEGMTWAKMTQKGVKLLRTSFLEVGRVVFRGMILVITPPSVSRPRERGVTSSSTIFPTSPERTPACKYSQVSPETVLNAAFWFLKFWFHFESQFVHCWFCTSNNLIT